LKKILAALLFAVLALAPLASACDANYPNGIKGSPIKVNVAGCSADNYTPKDPEGACTAARSFLVPYLNEKATNGNTYAYENDKNEANLIVYFVAHEVTPGDDNVVGFSLKVYGMGRSADGHTLFTAVGTPASDQTSITSALEKLQSFLENGWVCN
jgi:hypothetical protein